MSEPIQTYTTRVQGFLRPRHELLDDEGNRIGVLTVTRNRWGLVVGGEYRPEQGEVLSIQRNPGLLRAQFSIWTEGREWLCSSLRARLILRQIDLSAGSKPYRLVPEVGFRRGWRVVAPKTGDLARIRFGWRGARLELLRKFDLELLVFAYFLGCLTPNETLWPTVLDAGEHMTGKDARPSGA